MKTKEYLHILQDGSAVSFKDPAGMFEGLVSPSTDVSHPYGHLSHPSQAHFIVFLQQQGDASNSELEQPEARLLPSVVCRFTSICCFKKLTILKLTLKKKNQLIQSYFFLLRGLDLLYLAGNFAIPCEDALFYASWYKILPRRSILVISQHKRYK